MIRRLHRVSFRLSDQEYKRYSAMIWPKEGSIVGCYNMTRLILKGLEDLYQIWDGSKQPLGSSPLPEIPKPQKNNAFNEEIKRLTDSRTGQPGKGHGPDKRKKKTTKRSQKTVDHVARAKG